MLLDTLGSVLFKHGTNQLPEPAHSGWRGHIEAIFGALKRKEIAFGVLVYIVEAIVWLGFLSTTALSIASPLGSVNNILVLIASALFLKETVGKRRWLGALLIVIGIFLVGSEMHG